MAELLDRNGVSITVGRFVRVVKEGDRDGLFEYRGEVRSIEPDARHGHVLTIDVWKGGRFNGRSRVTAAARAIVAPLPEVLAERDEIRTRARLASMAERQAAEARDAEARIASAAAAELRERRARAGRKAARTRRARAAAGGR